MLNSQWITETESFEVSVFNVTCGTCVLVVIETDQIRSLLDVNW
jgi:hypothetical protein